MIEGLVLTQRVDRSELSDGGIVYTATFEEMPGIVAEGESEQAALAELHASIHSLHERLGVPAIGLRTEFATDWVWQVFSDGKADFSLSTGSGYRLPASSVPDNYQELQPLT